MKGYDSKKTKNYIEKKLNRDHHMYMSVIQIGMSEENDT